MKNGVDEANTLDTPVVLIRKHCGPPQSSQSSLNYPPLEVNITEGPMKDQVTCEADANPKADITWHRVFLPERAEFIIMLVPRVISHQM
ncbi:hypothetical protein ILYODFUR_037222 [Ilyodon furcidens]|uniref:Ig-like domain-containing protein n=1 Tax=Ilyodon furcidens TaxID=33524 RepID=A0ABV0U1K9_9TELE